MVVGILVPVVVIIPVVKAVGTPPTSLLKEREQQGPLDLVTLVQPWRGVVILAAAVVIIPVGKVVATQQMSKKNLEEEAEEFVKIEHYQLVWQVNNVACQSFSI